MEKMIIYARVGGTTYTMLCIEDRLMDTIRQIRQVGWREYDEKTDTIIFHPPNLVGEIKVKKETI